MTLEQLANVGILLLTWLVAGWTVTFGVPLWAREIFASRVQSIGLAVQQRVLNGALPRDNQAIVEFREVIRFMVRNPFLFGFAEAAALHAAHQEVDLPEPEFSYASLDPSQRRFMHDQERRLNAAVRHYIVFGSRFWVIGVLIVLANKVANRVGWRKSAPTTAELAREVRAAAPARHGGHMTPA